MAAASTSGVGLGREPPTAAGVPRRSESRWWWARLMEENHSVAESFSARRLEERLINDYVVLQSAARKVATVLAYLLLTWSTVVLLGGFVSVLKLIDFCCLTAISTSFAINLGDLFEYTTTYLLAAGNVYIGLRDDLASWSSYSLGVSRPAKACLFFGKGAKACLGVLIIVHFVVAQVLTLAPLVAIVLSLSRLLANNYGNAGGDAVNAAKLKASLQIFYTLALAQNVPFYFWKYLVSTERRRASGVSRRCRFGKWGSRLVRTYLTETKTIFDRERALPQGRNLITFAVGLLGSESLHDHCSAVRMLDTFVKNKVPIGRSLLPSKGPLENLMQVLEVGDGETRERAARIVVALAGDLRHIDQFPKALHHMASLLQASDQFPTTARPTTNMPEDQAATRKCRRNNGLLYWAILSCANFLKIFVKEKQEDTFPYGEPKQLISQGLLIIERLALHQGNRVHICNNRVLLSKLTAPLFSHAFLDAAEYGSEWVDMLGTSLRIISRLIRAPADASRGLRNGIASNTQAVSNLTGILEDEKFGPVLKAAAIDILAELASSSHKSATGLLDIKRFISRLWGIFLAQVDDNSTTIEQEEQRHQASRLRHKAGEALARMLFVWDAAASSSDSTLVEMFILQNTTSPEEVPTAGLRHVFGQLTDMLIKSNKGSRTSAARILECLCSYFTKHGELPKQDVIQMLRKVLQLIPCTTSETRNDTGLGRANNNLAAQSDEENPPPEDHTGNRSSSKKDEEQQEEKEFLVALLSLAVLICDRMVDAHDFTCAAPQDMVSLVKKLEDIIQTNNKSTAECLRTVKLTCQLVVSMVQLKPMCIKDFTEHNFKDVLSESLKILSDLDNCLVFFDVYDHHQVTKTDKPLVSLVKQAQELFDRAQEPGNVLA